MLSLQDFKKSGISWELPTIPDEEEGDESKAAAISPKAN